MTRVMQRFCFFLLLFSTSLQAQQVKIFQDEYGKQGEIRFSGIFSDSVLPKDGKLTLLWRETENKQLKTYRVVGQTKKHLPIGKWTWEEADWDYTVNTGSGITPLFHVAGTQMKWEGFFQNGVPEGKWRYTLDSVSSSRKSTHNLIQMDMQFKKGVISGNIVIRNNLHPKEFSMRGNCDNGIAEGTWFFSYKNENGNTVQEERIYKKGLLIEIKTLENGNTTVQKIAKNTNFIEALMRKQPIVGEKIGSHSFEQDEQGGISSELFYENIHYYFLRGWNLAIFPYEVIRFAPTFHRLEYPLTAQEINDFSRCTQLVEKQKKDIETQLDGNIRIHRSRSGELDTSIAFLQLQYKRLLYIDSVLNRVEQPFFTYKNRFNHDGIPWLDGLNKLRYTQGERYDSLRVELQELSTDEDSVHIFTRIKAVLEENERTFPHYFQIVEDVYVLVKQEGELKKLEDKIVALLQGQEVFYREKTGISAHIYTKWIKGEIESLLQDYARNDDYSNALEIGNIILLRLDSLQAWQQQITLFDTMQEALKAGYTYLVYNPYTGENDIAVTTKKRFLNTILTNLFPYMQQRMEQEQSWDKWGLYWQQQLEVFDFLIHFATKEDAHSKRIEKRIRKDKKAEKILKIILQELDDK